MGFFSDLLIGNEAVWGGGVAHSVLILSLVIATGILLGKIKIAGISLGVTWVLFVGIAFSHFGMTLNEHLIHFMKEFGLILFVFSIGLQVGPGFFSSFKKGGITLNMLAATVVLLGVLTTYIIHIVSDVPITTMVGILSGAVTNTPGLGAAQQAFNDMSGFDDPTIAAGYAVAYPLGVIGIIGTMIAIRYLFKVNLDKEENDIFKAQDDGSGITATPISLRVKNPAIEGKRVSDIHDLINRNYVISRIRHKDGKAEIASPDTILNVGDDVLVVTSSAAVPAITAFIGEKIDVEWQQLNTELISRRILITKSELNGKSLAALRVGSLGVNITRVSRAGIDLVARPAFQVQIGDKLTVVGTAQAIKEVEKILGNSMKRLDAPNLFTIFLGIAFGVVFGSIPFVFPGVPQPVKLGLAGGPLIVSILMSRFGPKFGLITYTTLSANLMLRELGITIFLACVGLGAGEGFVRTVAEGGYVWVGYGAIITVVPLIMVGIFARKTLKLNYLRLMGLIAGSTTDPPALAYANETAGNDAPAVAYATIYPLTMFLRVLSAQLLILFLA